ncbi:MAG: tRNA uridine(34) 5-carboxymethylaminomethyl modification radical SAM/GNAT enzyme Elp3 [Candidatus Paceibacterota bacterium]|jgi:elongator complex protein 3
MTKDEEIVKKLIKENPRNYKELSAVKRIIGKTCQSSLPSNRYLLELYHNYLKKEKIKKNEQLEYLLRIRKIRSLSGIAVITIATKPFSCPGECLYCPNQKKMPKSYLKNEPAIMRALRNNFDPYRQVEERIISLEKNGHPVDKIELIIIGGTWSYLPYQYRAWFIKRAFDACNQKTASSLLESQKLNEKAKHRIIGITVETRPDFITEKEIIKLRKLGITRVELGVQSVYDEILKLNQRGHNVETSIKATKLLKDAGFKVCYHIMPNLPGATPEKDLKMFKILFEKQEFKPDLLKIYPTVVLKEAPLYQWQKKGIYKTYSDKNLKDLLKKIILSLPYYCRLQRMIRDIPAPSITTGSKISNLREIIEKEIRKEKLKIWEIRFREVKENYNPLEKIYLFRQDYPASEGKEIFLSFENKKRTKLYSLLRLRIPSYVLEKKRFFIRALENSALIREVHTYGQLVPLSKQKLAPQHRGLGKKLIKETEKIAKKEFGLKKIAVISGVGVRAYYRKLGYRLEETYMIKKL